MEIKIEGRIIQKMEIESGTSSRGEWKKQNFIIETEEQFPRKICIGLWTNMISVLEPIQVGERITAYVNIESREFKGKWYTDVRAWKLERSQPAYRPEGGETAWGGAPMPVSMPASIPVPETKTPDPMGISPDNNPGTNDDLPF